MKRKSILFSLWILGISIAMTVMLAVAYQRVAPPSPSSLVGAWVGYEGGGVYFYRVVLQANNKGSCVVLYNDEAVDTYRVDNWQLQGRALTLAVLPLTRDSEKIEFAVKHVESDHMNLVVRGVTEKWERKLLLYNEKELLKKIAKCVEQGKKSGLSTVDE